MKIKAVIKRATRIKIGNILTFLGIKERSAIRSPALHRKVLSYNRFNVLLYYTLYWSQDHLDLFIHPNYSVAKIYSRPLASDGASPVIPTEWNTALTVARSRRHVNQSQTPVAKRNRAGLEAAQSKLLDARTFAWMHLQQRAARMLWQLALVNTHSTT